MILYAKNLSIGYDKTVVQDKINISARKGKLICLVGQNGYGKSTLLRTLGGLQPALEGTVIVKGQNIVDISDYKRSLLISLVLTDRIDVENLTVFDLISLGRYPYTSWNGTLSPKDKEIVMDAIKQVGIISVKDRMINQISDGQKQRAVIAKAIVQDTPLVILDEPTSHLDLSSRIDIMFLLKTLSKVTQKTFILSTHELDLAIKMADYLWLMQRDKITVGVPEDLLLSGIFQKSFASDNFNFDTEDGHYLINQPKTDRKVAIVGDTKGEKAKWLRCALNRCGIMENRLAETKIEITENRFVFNNFNTDFIEEVIDRIN